MKKEELGQGVKPTVEARKRVRRKMGGGEEKKLRGRSKGATVPGSFWEKMRKLLLERGGGVGGHENIKKSDILRGRGFQRKRGERDAINKQRGGKEKKRGYGKEAKIRGPTKTKKRQAKGGGEKKGNLQKKE